MRSFSRTNSNDRAHSSRLFPWQVNPYLIDYALMADPDHSAVTRCAVFLGAKRTAFGTFNGTLKDFTATDLGVHAAKAAIANGSLGNESDLSATINALLLGF